MILKRIRGEPMGKQAQSTVAETQAGLQCSYEGRQRHSHPASMVIRADLRTGGTVERKTCYAHQRKAIRDVEQTEGIDPASMQKLRIRRFIGLCITSGIADSGIKALNEASRTVFDGQRPVHFDHCKRLPRYMERVPAEAFSCIVCSEKVEKGFLRDVRDEYIEKGANRLIVRYVPM